MSDVAPKSLSHIRVLDLSRVLAGPWATQLMADLGAEVIKIERPGAGDDTRSWGPPYLLDLNGRETGESAYYLCANRGKKSVTIDITHPTGQEIVKKLAAQSDVFIENFRVGGLRRYGLAYADLKAVNPRLIYCSISGFGQSGPYAEVGGYDFVIQGMSGLMSITGERDDVPGGGPQKMGVAIADVLTGMYATVAILAALTYRQRSGQGQYIDLALLDSQIAALANQNLNFLVSGHPPARSGNAHPNIVPYQVFDCCDGKLVLAVGNDRQFARLCELVGREELADDPRFATNPARVRHHDALVSILAEIFVTKEVDVWTRSLIAAGVPGGPINDLQQVFADPHVKHRGLRIDLPHALAGTAPSVANPIRFSETPAHYGAAAPILGEHTREILSDLLHFERSDLERLAKDGVI